MKKIFLLLSIITLTLQSCSSGDSDNNSNSSVTDIDGNVYQTVTICNQTWTKTNLNVSKYRNGDVIPQVTDPTAWVNLTTGAWCYYANTSSNGTTYGKLYNWYAVNDPRGLAPVGYHIPSDAEWTSLINCLGGEAVAGGKMKEAGTIHWTSPNTGATNESGFTGLPGGFRSYSNGLFAGNLYVGFWWSSSQDNTNNNAITCSLENNFSEVMYDNFGTAKTFGFSIRCIKD